MSIAESATTIEPTEAAPPESASPPQATLRRAPWFVRPVGGSAAFVIIFLCAVVSGFADPDFGPEAWQKSTRILASLLVAYYLVNYGALLLVVVFGRRPKSGHRPRLTSRWLFVPAAVLMAVYARSTGISPVLVFASVVAVSFGVRAGSVRSAVSSILGVLWAAAIGVAGYVAYSALVAHPVQSFVHWGGVSPGDRYALSEMVARVNVAAGELFAIIAVVACTSLAVGLLPFVSFTGVNVWRATRAGWVVLYALGVALFMTVVIPVGHEGAWTGPARWWVGLYVAYAVLSFAAVAVMRGREPRRDGR